MQVLRLLLTPTEKLLQPQRQLQAHNPKLFPEHSGLYTVCAQHTLLPPAFPVLPCHLYWCMGTGALLSQGRLGTGRSPAKQSCLHPVTEENVRPAANFARSQTSLQQFPTATETLRSPPLWCSTRTRINLLLKARSGKSPGV